MQKNDHVIHSFVERLHEKVNQLSFEKKGLTFKVRATFGAVIRHANESTTPQSLIEKADDLLITAKSKQKGTVLW